LGTPKNTQLAGFLDLGTCIVVQARGTSEIVVPVPGCHAKDNSLILGRVPDM
jgi:hypothetical protein